MSRAALNVLLLLAVAAVTALDFGLSIDPDRRNLEVLPDMAHSPRANAFSASTVLAGGMTEQAPPAGTVPIGFERAAFGPGPEEAARAGRELASPIDLAAPAVQDRGASVFATFCVPCHGAGGSGDGPVARRGFPPPPPLTAAHAVGLPDGQIFHIITFGQRNMPSYAAQVSPEDRWNAVSYIRWLQRQNPPTAGSS